MATKAADAKGKPAETKAPQSVTLGGRKRTLRFGWKAIRAVEAQTGVGYAEIFSAIQRGRIGYLVDLVWAGLLYLDEPPDIEQVEMWFDNVEDLSPIIDTVNEHGAEAVRVADPQKKKAD